MARGPSKRQMGVGLPDELRAQLEAAASAADQSLAEEIRQRVERSFAEDARDPVLRDLLDDVEQLVELVKFDVGEDWQSSAGAHAVFRSAVLALIDERKPKGAPIFGAVRDLLGAGI